MTKPPSPRPLSIKVIAILFVLSGTQYVYHLYQHYTLKLEHLALVLGVTVSGQVALYLDFLLMFLSFYIGFGLWRLSEFARKVAVGVTVYVILTIMIWLVQHTAGKSAVPVEVYGGVIWLVSSVCYSMVVIWFLIKQKSAFVKPAKSP